MVSYGQVVQLLSPHWQGLGQDSALLRGGYLLHGN